MKSPYEKLNHDELPVIIKSIIPKNKFHSAITTGNTIHVYNTFDIYADVWKLINGRWEFQNPTHK